jgi:hypothetical protein
MSFELNEKTIALWCVELGHGNYMAMLSSTPEAREFRYQYRFRYYKDDIIDETSEDEKNWYGGTVTGKRDVVLGKIRIIYNALALTSPVDQHWELVRGDETADEFCARLGQQPGMHMKVLGRVH